METLRRSVVKAVVWNVMGLAVMTLVGLIATGSAAVGGVLALINTAIKRPAFNLKHPISLFAFDQRERQRTSDSFSRPGAPGLTLYIICERIRAGIMWGRNG